jgi:hypothetical protein
MTVTTDCCWYEFINIGDKQYVRSSDRMEWRLCTVSFYEESGAISAGPCVSCVEIIFEHPELLIDIEKLPDKERN